MRKALLLSAGWLLIVTHAVQLAFVSIASVQLGVDPVAPEMLERLGIQPWSVYYGTVTTVIEAVVLIVLAALVLRSNPLARGILLWVLALVIGHGIAWSLYVDLPIQEAVFSAGPDIGAWLALLAARGAGTTAPARR